jgi:alkanesulfonate monooxygenase SsuD/methylene tetrahydromethanopterin reductase-like flavin-dependent oxidoreductase (luciferase family)
VSFVGSPVTVAAQMRDFVERTQADELMVVSHIYDQSARLRSYEIAAATMIELSVRCGGEAPVGQTRTPSAGS